MAAPFHPIMELKAIPKAPKAVTGQAVGKERGVAVRSLLAYPSFPRTQMDRSFVSATTLGTVQGIVAECMLVGSKAAHITDLLVSIHIDYCPKHPAMHPRRVGEAGLGRSV